MKPGKIMYFLERNDNSQKRQKSYFGWYVFMLQINLYTVLKEIIGKFGNITEWE